MERRAWICVLDRQSLHALTTSSSIRINLRLNKVSVLTSCDLLRVADCKAKLKLSAHLISQESVFQRREAVSESFVVAAAVCSFAVEHGAVTES